jgi:hypothetical protein
MRKRAAPTRLLLCARHNMEAIRFLPGLSNLDGLQPQTLL